MSELDELLAQERQVGTFDSTGFFTLSRDKGLEKLSRFQLRSREEGLLKILQGVVAQAPHAVWIDVNASHLSVSWSNPNKPLEVDEFAAGFEEVLLGGIPGTAYDLALGLCSFLSEQPRGAWWAVWQGGEPQRIVRLFGEDSKAQLWRPPQRAGDRVHSLTIAREKQQAHPLQREFLAARSMFCPLPLFYNGRLLSELTWQPPRLDHQPKRTQLPYLLDAYWVDSKLEERGLALKPIGETLTLTGTALPSWGTQRDERQARVAHRRTLGVLGPRLTLRGRLPQIHRLSDFRIEQVVGLTGHLETSVGSCICVLDREFQGRSVLYPVKLGVTLDPIALPFQLPGAVVVAAMSDVEVDLTQFRLSSGPQLELALERLRQQLVDLLLGLESAPAQVFPDRQVSLGRFGAVTSTMAVMAFSVLAPMSAVAAALGGGFVCEMLGMALDKRVVVPRRRQRLKETLRQFAEVLMSAPWLRPPYLPPSDAP